MIKSLSKKEFNQLEHYINSPFFLKKNKDPLNLYLSLKEYAPKFDATNLTKEAIFEAVYPKVNYNDGKIRNLLSRTVKIVDNYLLYLDNEGDEFGRDKRLSEVYNKRNIESEFFNYSRRLLGELDKEKRKGLNYFYNKFSLEKEMYFHPQGHKFVNINLIENAFQNFHNYIALEQANIELELINRERIFNEKHNIPLLTYSKKLTGNNLTLSIIGQINKLLVNNDLDIFKKIMQEFKEQFNLLKNSDSVNIYMALQNFLGQQTYTNPTLINKFKHELNQFAIKQDLMIINDYLMESTYINIVISGNNVQKYDWVKNFIQNYQSQLRPENSKFIKNMGLSLVFFEEGNYREVIKLMGKYSIPSANWVPNARIIQIRSLFHLFLDNSTYYKPLLNQCEAFEKFLKRKTHLGVKRKIMSLNFIKIMRRLANTINRNKWNESNRQKFLVELKNNGLVSSRPWLQKVLNEDLK